MDDYTFAGNIRYGTVISANLADDVLRLETTKLFEGKEKRVVMVKQRIAVVNEKEELAEFIRFQREVSSPRRVSFEMEVSERSQKQGHYYVIKTWLPEV